MANVEWMVKEVQRISSLLRAWGEQAAYMAKISPSGEEPPYLNQRDNYWKLSDNLSLVVEE